MIDLSLISNATVLYVEDDITVSKNFEETTSTIFKKILTAYNGKEGIELFEKYQDDIDVIITDIVMPYINGIDMIRAIREINFEVPIIITSAFNDKEILYNAINLSVDGFVKKPFEVKPLMQTIHKALKPVFYKKEIAKKDQILFQQSKFSALGEMIGNIAHQWRQPLNSIGANIMKLEIQNDHGKLTNEDLKDIIEKTNSILSYMSKTIDDFRYFFEPDKSKEDFLLEDIIQGIHALMTTQLLQHNISFAIKGDQKIVIHGFLNELKQVLINLISNAKDAIVTNKIPEGMIVLNIDKSENSLLLTVKDNGGGIKNDILDKVFEPYFTTKFKSQGTGIGLYMSKTIIEKKMNGSLTAHNIENGALFEINLPLY